MGGGGVKSSCRCVKGGGAVESSCTCVKRWGEGGLKAAVDVLRE